MRREAIVGCVVGVRHAESTATGCKEEALRRKTWAGFALGNKDLDPFWKQLVSLMRNDGMEYRCVATSVGGFVQQLVSCYLPHGYWFYVSGVIPPGKDPADIDEKLLAKYGIGVSRTSRARRKSVGIANVHYIRYYRRFLLLATHGFHPFYDEEAKSIRDVRRIPIRFEGYSISVAKGGFLRKPNDVMRNPAAQPRYLATQ